MHGAGGEWVGGAGRRGRERKGSRKFSQQGKRSASPLLKGEAGEWRAGGAASVVKRRAAVGQTCSSRSGAELPVWEAERSAVSSKHEALQPNGLQADE